MKSIYSEQSGVIRIYENGKSYELRDEYIAIMNVYWTSDKSVFLSSFMTRTDLSNVKTVRNQLFSVFKILYEKGATTATLKRSNGKKMPFAKILEVDEYETTWEIDLVKIGKVEHETNN